MKKRFASLILALCLVLAVPAALAGCGSGGTYATQKNFITIGCVCPLTGDLASFGEGSLETENAAVEEINQNGGIYVDSLRRKMKIRFLIADSYSTESGAQEAARKLIEEDHVDAMICSSGTMTVCAVAQVCEANQVPFFSTNADMDTWLAGGPYKYCFNAASDVESRMTALYEVIEQNGCKSVAFLAPDTYQSEVDAAKLMEFCDMNGLKFLDPGRIASGIADNTAILTSLTKAKPDVLLCQMSASDFGRIWETAGLKNIGAKMIILQDEAIKAEDIRSIKSGASIGTIYTTTCWDTNYPFPSSLTKQESVDLGIWWDDLFTSEAPQLLGYKHAVVENVVNAVKLAMSVDKEEICSAAKSLDTDTILGPVDFDSQGACVLPCSVICWTYQGGTGTFGTWKKELVSHEQVTDEDFEDE